MRLPALVLALLLAAQGAHADASPPPTGRSPEAVLARTLAPGPVYEQTWDDAQTPRIGRKRAFSERVRLTDLWSSKITVRLPKKRADAARAERVDWGHHLDLLSAETGALSLNATYKSPVEWGERHRLEIGPEATWSLRGLELSLESYLETKLGGGEDPNLEAEYGFAAMHEVVGDLKLGLRAEGELPDLLQGPPTEVQEHAIGPALDLELDLPEERRGRLKAGVMLGLTEATDHMALKLNYKMRF